MVGNHFAMLLAVSGSGFFVGPFRSGHLPAPVGLDVLLSIREYAGRCTAAWERGRLQPLSTRLLRVQPAGKVGTIMASRGVVGYETHTGVLAQMAERSQDRSVANRVPHVARRAAKPDG